MALLARPFVAQLATDVLARWVSRATGLTPVVGDANQPRAGLPYVSVTFPRGRPATGYRRSVDHAETLGAQTLTGFAADPATPITIIANGARVSVLRGSLSSSHFAVDLAGALGWWLRGRCGVAGVGDDVVVTPLSPGLLLQLDALEGATLVEAEPGPPARLIERLYRATCRVQVLGGVTPAQPGQVGEGLDAYTIEAAMREHLSDYRTRQELRAAQLVPHGLPEGEPSYASSISGSKREVRNSFDLEFGWTGWYREDAEPLITAGMNLNGESGGGSVLLGVGLP